MLNECVRGENRAREEVGVEEGKSLAWFTWRVGGRGLGVGKRTERIGR